MECAKANGAASLFGFDMPMCQSKMLLGREKRGLCKMWIREVEFPPPYTNNVLDNNEKDESPESPKAPVKAFMRFGIDIDGTISRAPKHFKRLINALIDSGNSVYIITARDAGRRTETEEFLYSLGIRYTRLVMKPLDWPHTIPDFKVEVARQKDLHMLIDDEDENCWAVEMRTRALAARMLPHPPLTEEFEDYESRTGTAGFSPER